MKIESGIINNLQDKTRGRAHGQPCRWIRSALYQPVVPNGTALMMRMRPFLVNGGTFLIKMPKTTRCSTCTFAQKCIRASVTFGVCMTLYTQNHKVRLTLIPRVRLCVIHRAGLRVELSAVFCYDWRQERHALTTL